jgi:hypothetical protein
VQDRSEASVTFRGSRLNAVSNIRHELDNRGTWPPQLAGTDPRSQVLLDPELGNFNIRSADGKPGLICYLGEGPLPRKIENSTSKLIELLRRSGGNFQKRLCVVYRKFGELHFANLPGLTRFDEALLDERDITSADPAEGG